MSRLYTISIRVVETGARATSRSIQSIGEAAQKATKPVNTLQNTLRALGTVLIAERLTSYTNELQTLRNRLAVVTTTTEDAAAVFGELRRISDDTRSSIFETANVYSRFSLATRDLGISQQEVLNITERLNEAVILSGANAREVEAGLLQFSQGLASGRLAGDELRAVLEQLPIIADVIGKELGVTRGALRFLAKEGKITPEVIVRAFRNADAELKEKFAKTVPTISQAFIVLHNAAIDVLNTFDNSTGVLGKISSLILLMAKNIDTLARVVITGVLLTAIYTTIAAVNKLTVAIAANPIGALLFLITATATALVAFSDKIKVGTDGVTTLWDVIVAAVDEIWKAITPLFDEVLSFFNQFSNNEGLLLTVIKNLAIAGDAVIGFFRGIVFIIRDNLEILPRALLGVLQLSLNSVAQFIEDVTDYFVAGIRTISELVLGFDIVEVVRDIFARLVKVVAAGIKGIVDIVPQIGPAIAQGIDASVVAIEQTLKSVGINSNVKEDYLEGFRTIADGISKTFQEKLNSEQQFNIVPRVSTSGYAAMEQLGENMGKSFNRGFGVTVLQDAVTRILFRARELAAERVAREQANAAQGSNLNAPGVQPTGLRSLSDVVIDRETEALRDQAGALALLNSERRAQVHIQQELERLYTSVGEDKVTEEHIAQFKALVRLRIAFADTTNALDQFSEGLLTTSQGMEIFNNVSQDTQAKMAALVDAMDAGTITGEQFNFLVEQLNQSLKVQRSIIEDLFGPQLEYEEKMKAIAEVTKLVSNDTDKLKLQLLESKVAYDRFSNDPTPFAGIMRGIETVRQEILNIGKLYEDAFVSAFRGAEDALVDFIVTGKNGFRDLAESIAKDLVRIGLRQFFTQPLFGALFGSQSGDLGGLFGQLVGAFGGGRAAGGPVFAGQSYLVGENGPELLQMGSTSGRVVPNEQLRGGDTYVFNLPGIKDTDNFRRSQPQIIRGFQDATRRRR